jgi:hypothetical protein
MAVVRQAHIAFEIIKRIAPRFADTQTLAANL